MKLLYQGDTPLESTARRQNRSWFKELCWEAVGVIVLTLAFWALTVLMFVM